MNRAIFLVSVAAAALVNAVPAYAQDEEKIVMRRPLNVSTAGVDWRVSPFAVVDGSGNEVDPAAACGPFAQVRSVDCVRDGQVVNDSFCRDVGPRPTNNIPPTFFDAGCTYSWNAGGFQDPGPSCSLAEVQTQVVECLRDFDSAVMDNEALCGTGRPPATRTVEDFETCTYTWATGAYIDPGANCTAEETQNRTVTCERDLDGSTVSDGLCNPALRPVGSQTVPDYSSCTYSWTSGAWNEGSESCTDKELQTREVRCERDLDGNIEDDAQCNAAARPNSTQEVEDYSGCKFKWEVGDWQDPGASCTATEAQTRSVTCLRSDGTTMPTDGPCSSLGAKPTGSRNVADFSDCSYSVRFGAWSAWSSSCSANAQRTRSIATCRRSDGTDVANSECSSRGLPTTETDRSPQYSGCSYSGEYGNWGAWSSTCSATANRTQSMTVCRRSDGTSVPTSECTSRSIPLTRSETSPQYGGCSYSGEYSGWSNYNSTCSANATRTRTLNVCRRSDGTSVSAAECNSRGIPSTLSETTAVFSGCSYTAEYNPWSAWNSSCSTSAQRTRTMAVCRRSDGASVSATECNSRGMPSTEVDTSSQLGGCSYSAEYGAWSNYNSTCSANATRTRNITVCRRSDGASVAGTECSSRGIPLTQSESTAVLSGCSYSGEYGAWSGWNSTCSANAQRTRTMTACRRSDGTSVAGTECSSRGIPLTQSETSSQLGGCTYSAQYGNWSGWNSSCSTSAQRSRNMTLCLRSDGTSVAGSECSSRGMPLTQTETSSQLGGCSYSAEYGGWSGWSSRCSTNATRTRNMSVCRRSDGASVSGTECTSRGMPSSQSENSTQLSGCSFSASYSGWSACSNGSQTRTMQSCTAGGIGNVSTAECTSRGIPATQSQACSLPPLNAAWCQSAAPSQAVIPHQQCVAQGANTNCVASVPPAYNQYTSATWAHGVRADGLHECFAVISFVPAMNTCRYLINPTTRQTFSHNCTTNSLGI